MKDRIIWICWYHWHVSLTARKMPSSYPILFILFIYATYSVLSERESKSPTERSPRNYTNHQGLKSKVGAWESTFNLPDRWDGPQLGWSRESSSCASALCKWVRVQTRRYPIRNPFQRPQNSSVRNEQTYLDWKIKPARATPLWCFREKNIIFLFLPTK